MWCLFACCQACLARHKNRLIKTAWQEKKAKWTRRQKSREWSRPAVSGLEWNCRWPLQKKKKNNNVGFYWEYLTCINVHFLQVSLIYIIMETHFYFCIYIYGKHFCNTVLLSTTKKCKNLVSFICFKHLMETQLICRSFPFSLSLRTLQKICFTLRWKPGLFRPPVKYVRRRLNNQSKAWFFELIDQGNDGFNYSWVICQAKATNTSSMRPLQCDH